MKIVGHDGILARLVDTPPVVLLVGPPSIGKRAVCRELADRCGAAGVDRVEYDRLTAEAAREIVEFISFRPRGESKAIIARLDSASPEALNRLLKVTEEPPSRTHFFFTASRNPMLTIASRAFVVRMGSLTDAQVAQVLVERFGWEEPDARRAAARSQGRVDQALTEADLGIAKGPVLTLLRAASQGDELLFANGIVKFDREHLGLLRTWAMEARTGAWHVFDPGDGAGFTKPVLDHVRRMTGSGARPKVAARAALWPVLERGRG